MSNFSRLAWEQALSVKKERDMIPLPDLEFEEHAFTVDAKGELKPHSPGADTAAYVDVCLKVSADADGTQWEITEIYFGEKCLSGAFEGAMINYFAWTKSGEVWDHVRKHLPGILSDARDEKEANL